MGKLTVYTPPQYPLLNDSWEVPIFLGGSIEMGKAIKWQDEFINMCKEKFQSSVYHLAILNPRRDDWDSTWKQSIENGQFYQQVDWELYYLEKCKFKLFYFAKDTMSPISLLEFGRFSALSPEKILLCVDKEYGRKGNLDVYCHKYQIPQYNSLEEIVNYLKKMI